MKKLLVLIALIGAVGCTKHKEVQEKAHNDELFEPKYTLGQQVTPTKGFLKGQTGIIKDCTRCKADGQGTYSTDVVCYTIEFKIGEETRTYQNVSERELEF
jgi:hypothetical protein